MPKQYDIISQILRMIKEACFSRDAELRFEFLLYRLKLLILKQDRFGMPDISLVCPVEDLEQLRALIEKAQTRQDAEATRQVIEDRLAELVRRMDPEGDQKYGAGVSVE